MEPGFKQIKICLYLPESIHEFRCSYKSVAGKITVRVKEEKDSIQLSVEIPEAVKYQIDTTNLENSRAVGKKRVKTEIKRKI